MLLSVRVLTEKGKFKDEVGMTSKKIKSQCNDV